MNKNLPLLMDRAYYGFNRGLDGDFKPIVQANGSVKTFCNEFIQSICNAFGYNKFNGLVANQMVTFMSDYKNGWIVLDEPNAQQRANEGALVIAGRGNPARDGHVCLLVPGILENSNSYGRPVPKCANVGKDVFFGKRISFAFLSTEMPTYFALSEMI